MMPLDQQMVEPSGPPIPCTLKPQQRRQQVFTQALNDPIDQRQLAVQPLPVRPCHPSPTEYDTHPWLHALDRRTEHARPLQSMKAGHRQHQRRIDPEQPLPEKTLGERNGSLVFAMHQQGLETVSLTQGRQT